MDEGIFVIADTGTIGINSGERTDAWWLNNLDDDPGKVDGGPDDGAGLHISLENGKPASPS
jgi:hypothetical protein